MHVSHLQQSILKTFSPRDAMPAMLMSIYSCSLASRSWGLCAVPSPMSCSGVSMPSGPGSVSSWHHQVHKDAQWLSQSSAKAQVDSKDTLLLEASSLCWQHVPLILLFCWENFHLLFSWVIPSTFNHFVRHTGQLLLHYTRLGGAGANRVQEGILQLKAGGQLSSVWNESIESF